MNVRHYTGFRVKEAIGAIALVGIVCVGLSGCKDSTNQGFSAPPTALATPTPQEGFSLNSLLNSIDGAASGVKDVVRPHSDAVQARTKEEVEKLFHWEYKVVDLPAALSAIEQENEFKKLGQDNWECFDIMPVSGTLRITCKRRPPSAISYLKYIPGL